MAHPELPRKLDDVERFLEENKPIDELQYYHDDTILHQLCYGGYDTTIVKQLLNANAAVHVNTQNDKMQTPLHCILQKPHPSQDFIKLLLDHKASLEIEDHLKHPPFFTAIKGDQVDSLKILRAYAQKNYKIDLIHQISSFNCNTALHCACAGGRVRSIEYLLSHNADINARDQNNETPIFATVNNQQLDSLDILLRQKELNIYARSSNRNLTVMHFACGKSSHLFAKYILDSLDSPHKLLRMKDVQGRTPIFSASLYQRPEIVKLLLERNASPNSRDAQGRTVVFDAVQRGFIEIVKILLEGVTNVNLQDKWNNTPLTFARAMNSIEMIELLKQYGAQEDLGSQLPTQSPVNSVAQLPAKRKRESLDLTGNIDFNNIQVLEQIGSGAFGRVHRGEWLGTVIAIKFFSHTDAKKQAMFSQEIELLKSLNHPHIVNCFGDCISGTNEQCMVMEYLPGTLSDAIESRDFTLSQMISIMKGIASGMVYLHRKQIIHRDLKPSNILLTNNLEPKLADFGISRTCEGIATMTSIGTPLYMAPEMIRDKKYGDSVDVYSFAMIFLQLFTRRKLFYELGDRDSLNTVFQVIKNDLRPNIPSTVPDDIAQLIRKSWNADPNERPTFVEISKFLESKVEPSFNTDCNEESNTKLKTEVQGQTTKVVTE